METDPFFSTAEYRNCLYVVNPKSFLQIDSDLLLAFHRNPLSI